MLFYCEQQYFAQYDKNNLKILKLTNLRFVYFSVLFTCSYINDKCYDSHTEN